MPKKKLLIAANFKMDSQLKSYFENEMKMSADVFYVDSIGEKNNTNFYRHFAYFRVAWRAFFHRNSYSYIVFWQQFIGLYYGLISRLLFFLPTHSKSISLTLIFVKRQGIIGSLYYRFYRYMLNAKALTKAVVHSQIELHLYRKLFQGSANKLFFAEVGEGEPENYNPMYNKDIYFFSGGGSHRDYRALIEAFSQIDLQLKIACLPQHVKDIEIPPNVELIHNAWHEAFDDLVRQCYAVIIPVVDPNVSSGQLVLIKSMRMSKPTIVTAGNCMKDYTSPDAVISIPANSSSDLLESVIKLAGSPSHRNQMSKASFDLYRARFSRKQYVRRVCALLND